VVTAALRVRGLTVALDGAPILHGVDLDVAAGEWVTVIGPNGAGKSTLLRAVAGLLPAGGEVTLFGAPAGRMRRRERARTVALVPQTPAVPAGTSVLEYVLLGRTPHIPPLGRESRADLAAVAEVLQRLHLTGFADRPLERMSGGERQRAFLARALVQGAPLLLLDEPTTALDIGHQQEVLELVDSLRADRGLTVLSSMHDLGVAGEYADRLVLLAAGRVAAAGAPAEVLTARAVAAHYGARVRVVAGEHGPLVLPIRPVRPAPADAPPPADPPVPAPAAPADDRAPAPPDPAPRRGGWSR
jgi:cobalamin transport system ATP-binding protein